MKKLVAVSLFFLFTCININAQSDENPLLVVSFNQVPLSEMGKISRIGDSLFIPILKELVDEGMLYSFGRFTHYWGDEWNWNLWYTVKDMASFEKFWDEYVKRASEKHPGAFQSITKHFQAHKDNIYVIQNQYPVPPAR
jgi:hypothetical protein